MKYIKTHLLVDDKPDSEIIIILDNLSEIEPLWNTKIPIGSLLHFEGAGDSYTHSITTPFDSILQQIKEI